jgi:hypothetical protein
LHSRDNSQLPLIACTSKVRVPACRVAHG